MKPFSGFAPAAQNTALRRLCKTAFRRSIYWLEIMNFHLSNQDVSFEIPDAWLEAAGVTGFKPGAPSFNASSIDEWPTSVVALSGVEAPLRDPGVQWFHEERMISILSGMVTGKVLPPVQADEPLGMCTFPYRVKDGFHRFYASAALGFQSLPVSLRPHFNINDL